MSLRTVEMQVRVTVRLDPAGKHLGWWPRVRLALSILLGYPVTIAGNVQGYRDDRAESDDV